MSDSKIDSSSKMDNGARAPKPRGFYARHEPWSKDKTENYFSGPMHTLTWPLFKLSAILALATCTQCLFHSTWLTMAVCLAVICFYQSLIAAVVPNTFELPPMDHQTFISTAGVHVNYMNCTFYDDWDEGTLRQAFLDVMQFMPKFRYKLKEIAGDYYYESMPMEEFMQKFFVGPEGEDKVLTSQDDIN